ncbi:HHK17, histidine kinase-group VII protein [Sclerotinia borealis F-4128]|uniref:histidine kinase n=1 Tax=Sclerotinia borealis (strain F-4128) TaxID=1432307 RepID=W9CXD5_SCLBF|nr:HHK17, histidine kinase-group VII protein [Sclerotinia borealis F-4128]
MFDAPMPTSEPQSGMQDPRYYREIFDGKPCTSRIYKPHRQKTRRLPTKTPIKHQLLQRTGEEMTGGMGSGTQIPFDLIDRQTLCLPDFSEDTILHSGDEGFSELLGRYFPAAESNASERLVQLKAQLRKADTYDFWRLLMEEMCDITGAQCGLVAKRMLVDDQDTAVELPELGEEGSCLMGVAFYTKSGGKESKLERDYKYTAFGTPCAYMKYDKVVIVPERMKEVAPNNPNIMPWGQSEAFIGVPLFVEDKSFAHFTLIWSEEGAQKRRLSWSFIEMFMHSLEDMILQRIVEGLGFAKGSNFPESNSAKIIPLSAITASQSLKPYARSLSHELRTPMQGVVGMLDIMYSTILDAIVNEENERVRSVFADLKANVEIVQESSRRAIEAADNVVHAYDLNMQMPDVPLTPEDDRKKSFALIMPTYSPPGDGHLRKAFSSPILVKRRRPEDLELNLESPPKRMSTFLEREISHHLQDIGSTIVSTEIFSPEMVLQSPVSAIISEVQTKSNGFPFDSNPSPLTSPASMNPTHQRIVTRDFMRNLISDALTSDHSYSEHPTTTDSSEIIEVKTQSSRGEIQERLIELVIQPDVPEAILTEEQHLQFSISKVIDNAIKFTDEGSITITVSLNNTGHMVEIWVVDTGCGITEESKSRLFEPHFQENASISRAKDGLGLSLFNAKARVRKYLGGDVTLERSATDGPTKGSEFLIRLPISALDMKRAVTPLVGSSPSHPRITRDAVIPSYANVPTKNSRRRGIPNANLAKDYPLNFLVAEDNVINRNVAFTALSRLGYSANNITLAFDGADAVRSYKASLSKPSGRYNIILMDIWMPNMDGYQATKEILKLAEAHGETATIVAVTADITDDCSIRAKEAGMQSFLAKPYRVIDIERLIIGNFQQELFCCSEY